MRAHFTRGGATTRSPAGNERRPRVLVLNQYAVPRRAAGGTRHAELFERLPGWDYLIVAGRQNHLAGEQMPSDPDDHFRLLPVAGFERNDWRRVLNWLSFSVQAVIRCLRVPRPDVVYASTPHLLTPIAGWLLARRFRAALVVEVRDLWPDTLIALGRLDPSSAMCRALRALEKWMYRRADLIVGVSDGWRPYMAQLGVDDKYVAIPNGADPEDFRAPAERERSPLARATAERVAGYQCRLIYAGAHGPTNGLDEVLTAAAAFPGFAFVLVGGGMDKPRLMAVAQERDLRNVIFLDPVPKQDLAEILSIADIGVHCLVHSPLFELGMSPNKVHDYLASGLPVVSNVRGEIEAILGSAEAGVSADDLVAAISELAAVGPSGWREAGVRGRAWLTANRSRNTLGLHLAQVLDDARSAHEGRVQV